MLSLTEEMLFELTAKGDIPRSNITLFILNNDHSAQIVKDVAFSSSFSKNFLTIKLYDIMIRLGGDMNGKKKLCSTIVQNC